ncbi:MAG: capsule assembly Wzi family protein, partial [Muribaculaceae bacterium]|nr:capsule assembly Wzi family protein [Muribaculaceae bacterium]
MNRYFLILLFLVVYSSSAYSFELDWEASTTVNAGSGGFAPSLIMANRGGTITHSKGVYERAGIFHKLEPDKRFSYSCGLDAYVQATSTVDYMKWNSDTKEFSMFARRPSYAVIQQLYGLIKYRSLFLSVGMKEHDRTFLDNPLSSGDITLSNNARPVPQVRVGGYDYVNNPFTQGWVQIIGDIAYGKFMDSNWNKDHYNYYNSFLTTDVWFHYKRLYLRSNPKQRFVATVGMQHAAQFNGEYKIYRKGVCAEVYKPEHFLRSFLDVFVQAQYNSSSIEGESMNFSGNHLGSWDAKFEYKLKNNDIVSFYVMKPW